MSLQGVLSGVCIISFYTELTTLNPIQQRYFLWNNPYTELTLYQIDIIHYPEQTLRTPPHIPFFHIASAGS